MNRTMKQVYRLHSEDNGFALTIDNQNILKWQGAIQGKKQTPYENGIFLIDILIPEDYPMSSPDIKFVTPIFHPCVDVNGKIGHSILNQCWTPAQKIFTIVEKIVNMLNENPIQKHVLRPQLYKCYIKNRKQFDKQAKKHTEQHAM